MSNLIKNEFIKILKKKSLYIILIITLCYILLTNIMYKSISSLMYSYGYSEEILDYYEEDLKQLDPKNADDNAYYIELRSEIDILTLSKKYGFDSWQSAIIIQYLSDDINLMNRYTYSLDNSVTKEMYDSARENYDELIQKLDTDDWRYFATTELNDVNAEIQLHQEAKKDAKDDATLNSINDTLHYLEVQNQVLTWRLEKDINYAPSFLNDALESYINYDTMVYNYEPSDQQTYVEQQEYYSNVENLNINRYYIENNIKNITQNDNRAILLDLFGNYELFILIIIIMVAGSIVSDEFSKGTIKLLLVRPYSRYKILLAKFITCICILILSIILISVLQYIVGGVIQGFNSVKVPAVIYNFDTNQVETMGLLSYLTINACAKLPIYILLMTLAFACSTIFTNTAVSIAFPLLGYMASSIINQCAIAFDIKALLFFVTPNWDFTQYLFGRLPDFEGLTIPFSLIVCLVYFLIMIVITFAFFKKRDIKNI